jgi:uncharacterized protein YfiM (DUF2279 family)
MGEVARALLVLVALAGTPEPLDATTLQLSVAGLPAPETGAIAGRPADPWLGSDKFRHAWMSYAVTAFAFAGAQAVDVEARSALRLSVGVAGVGGVGKELHDRRSGGSFSGRDLLADAVGILAAYMILREVR